MWILTGLTLSLFLFLLLILKRGKSKADKVLAIWMGTIALHQGVFYLTFSDFSVKYPHFLGVLFPFPLLHGVLLFFYVSTLTQTRSITWPVSLIHFAPAIIITALAIPFYRLSGEEKLRVFAQEGLGYEWYSGFKLIMIVGVGLGYGIWSWMLIRKSRSALPVTDSLVEKKKLRWLELLTLWLASIWGMAFFVSDEIIFAGVVGLVLFIGLFGINQLPVFFTENIPFSPEIQTQPAISGSNEPVAPAIRYAKSGLTEDASNRVYAALTSLMETKSLYLQDDLTLNQLAEQLQIHPNYLSQVINEKEEKNFYQYLNSWRISAFMELAAEPRNKQYTLMALASDSGFKSKSTFIKYFKQATGKTPSEYFSHN